MEPGAAHGLQGGVIVFAAFAELVVGRIPQREHGEAESWEGQALIGDHRFKEVLGAIGRLAIPVGAHHQEGGLVLGEHLRVSVQHALQPHVEAQGRACLAAFSAQYSEFPVTVP